MKRANKLSMLASVFLLGACTIFPSARNLQIIGEVVDQSGMPMEGVEIYFVNMKYQITLSGMPSVASSGTVVTNAEGKYSINIPRAYDAIDVSIGDTNLRCGKDEGPSGYHRFESEIPGSVTLTHNFFVCGQNKS